MAASKRKRTKSPRSTEHARTDAEPTRTCTEVDGRTVEHDSWARVRWTLDALERGVRRVLEARGFDLSRTIRCREEEFPRQELHALGCIERCREAIREGDAPEAVLAMHDATQGFRSALHHRNHRDDELRGILARLTLEENAAKGGRARAEQHRTERDAPLLEEARRRWERGGRKPRDARRIAEGLRRDGYDSRSVETLRKRIAPALR